MKTLALHMKFIAWDIPRHEPKTVLGVIAAAGILNVVFYIVR